MLKRNLVAVMALCVPQVAWGQAPKAPAVVTTKCAICHGEKGDTVSEEFPRLAGQHEAYLAKELRDFKSGVREGIMVRMVRGLSDEDIAKVASYYAAQPARAPSAALSEIGAAGRYIYLHGNPYSGVPACKACHGEAAHGTAQLPRLAGQHASYLERQVKEFTQRKRTNDNEVMHAVAQKLTAFELRAVAEYITSLP
jgi:cytochrome c553